LLERKILSWRIIIQFRFDGGDESCEPGVALLLGNPLTLFLKIPIAGLWGGLGLVLSSLYSWHAGAAQCGHDGHTWISGIILQLLLLMRIPILRFPMFTSRDFGNGCSADWVEGLVIVRHIFACFWKD
jgi:hypothetical protein